MAASTRRLACGVAILLIAAPPAAGQALLTVEPAVSDYRPILRIGPLLGQDALREALRSGLPLRVEARIELWKDELLDELSADESFTAIVRYQPLDERYIVHQSTEPERALSFASYADARAAIERSYSFDIRPGRGRHYYLASVAVETLSLSDLEEVEHWLRGELRPAVGGDRSVISALAAGAKRLLIRVLGLPARHVEARSAEFTVR